MRHGLMHVLIRKVINIVGLCCSKSETAVIMKGAHTYMAKKNKKSKKHNLKANRNYKSTLFEMIFSRKEELLELYNAVNGSNYTDPDAV